MNPDPIEHRLSRLRTLPPSPALRTRVLATAQAAWAPRAADRHVFRHLALRWATALAAVWTLCLGLTLHEETLFTRAVATQSSRPPAETETDRLLRELDPGGSLIRFRGFIVAMPTPASSRIALRQRVLAEEDPS